MTATVVRDHRLDSPSASWTLPRSASRERSFGLDAARAAAIVLVLVAHGTPYWSPFLGDYADEVESVAFVAGVDGIELFFCLSGFLIGSLLLDLQHRNSSWRAIGVFLVRRWMRTLPLYYLVLLLLLLFPFLDPAPPERVWSYVLLVQNVVTPMPLTNWFGPTWSLTVEEWSYIALPLLAFTICRRTRHPVACAALILIVAGIAIRAAVGLTQTPWGLVDWDLMIRKVVACRADAVAYGALAAVWINQRGRLPRWTLPLAAVLIGWNVWACVNPLTLAGPVGWLPLFPLTAIGFALLLPWLAELPRPRWIGAPVSFIARISYALYLTHWSFVFIATHVAPQWQLAVYVGGSLLVASLASYAIEFPIMRLRPKQV